MDRLSSFGLILGVFAILGTRLFEGGSATLLFQGPAAWIVLAGTLAATLVASSSAELRHAGAALFRALRSAPNRKESFPAFYRDLAFLARKDGLVALEEAQVGDISPFAQRALRHLVDGCDESLLREILEADRSTRRREALDGAQVFELAGGFAPTMGILGAVLGLIQAMDALADPTLLGQGIAVAFISTLYGVGLANFALIPIGEKIRGRVRQTEHEESMIFEATLDLQRGLAPRMIERRLAAFLEDGSQG